MADVRQLLEVPLRLDCEVEGLGRFVEASFRRMQSTGEVQKEDTA